MQTWALAALALLAALGGPEQATQPSDLRDALKAAVREDSSGARARAKLTNEASAKVDELVAALADSDDDVRVSAAWALRFSASKNAVGPLTAALRDENFAVGRAASDSLAQFKAAEAGLGQLLKDPRADLRWRVFLYAEYTPIPTLVGQVCQLAVSDPVDYVRVDAAFALRRYGGPEAAQALCKCLADPYDRVRRQARESLKGKLAPELVKMGSPARAKAIAALLWVLDQHKDKPHAASAAAEVLTQLAVEPLGNDPAKWRKLLSVEGGEK
jgi:HEAT repeat protein